jgi:hypothetical protein
MATVIRGYNGNLARSNGEVTIERGVKGLLIRRRWASPYTVGCGELREVWFQPSVRGRRGLVGYVLLVTAEDQIPDDFETRARHDRAVTFLRRPDEWRAFANAVAEACGVPLHEFPPESRSGLDIARSRFRSRRDW